MKAIERVRVTHGDDAYGARVLDIRTSIEDIETPARAVTATEANAKSRIQLDEPLDNLVYEYNNQIRSETDIRALHRKNGSYANKLRSVKKNLEKFKGYALTKWFPQTKKDAVLSDRDIRVLLDLQLEAGADIVTIPEPSSTATLQGFVGNLNRSWEYVSSVSPNIGVMPYLHLGQDHEEFEKKLQVLHDHEGALLAIGLRFASITEFRPNYMSVAAGSDKDIWVHCSGGRRYPNYRLPIGQLHGLQRFGIDTMAVESPQAFPGKKPDTLPPPLESAKKAMYFVRDDLAFHKLGDLGPATEPLACTCSVCRQRPLTAVVDEPLPIGKIDEVGLRMNDAAKIHEVYASSEEFETGRERIREGSFRDYLRSKSRLRDYLEA